MRPAGRFIDGSGTPHFEHATTQRRLRLLTESTARSGTDRPHELTAVARAGGPFADG